MSRINLRKNIALSGSFRIFTLLLSFFISWISARFLGVELKGQLSYIITLGGFIWTALDLGLNHSYPYLIRKFPYKANNLLSWTLLAFGAETLVLLGLGLGLLGFWRHALSYDFSYLYMALFVLYITLTKAFMQTQAYFVGRDRIFHNSMGYLANSGLCLFLLLGGVLFFRSGDRLAFYLAITAFSLAAAFAYLLWQARAETRSLKPEPAFVRYSYGFGMRAFISMLLISLLVRADIVIVKHLLDFRSVGIYSISAHIVDMLQVASNLVGGLLLAKLSDTEDDVSRWVLMKKMLMIFGVFLLVANLGFVLAGKLMLGLFYGKSFLPSYDVYLWLIPASFGLSFGSLFNNYLNSKGFPVVTILVAGLALALNIVLNLLFIPLWGIAGAAIATSVAYLVWFALIIAYEQKLTGGRMIAHLIPAKRDWLDLYKEGTNTLAAGKARLRRKGGSLGQ